MNLMIEEQRLGVSRNCKETDMPRTYNIIDKIARSQ